MARGGAGIPIDWMEVFGASSPKREDVCFESSSPSSAPQAGARVAAALKRARARGVERPSSDDDKRCSTPSRRLQGLRGGADQRRWGERPCPGERAGDGAPRRVTRAAAKAASQGPGARSSAKSAFEFTPDDEREDMGRKYSLKSPYFSGKRNYAELPMEKRKSREHVGRKTISVNKMYGSPSTPSSGNQRRPHAIDPEESDSDKCQQSGKFSFSGLTKRRKEQLQNSSSAYRRKVQDVVQLDDEDTQTEGEVNYEMSDRRNEQKIYYPSRDVPEAVELASSDIECLDPGAFLSSPVINYYIQLRMYIKKTRLNCDGCRNNFYIFNTYFYGKLEEALYQQGDFSKLRRWWKGVNIFDRAYIIMPIHGTAHWSLVIICMPEKESISGPIILHLDSLELHRSNKILNTVESYLKAEWQHLKDNPSPDTSVLETWGDLPSNIHKQKVKVPQQYNGYDCGIFMLYYIERFIRDAPERFTIDKLEMFNCSWFKPEDASDLRRRIRELLLEVFESARLDDVMSDVAVSNDSDMEDNMKGGELEADAPFGSSEMVVDVGNTGRNHEGIKVATSEEECGEPGYTCKNNEGIKVAESEEATGESGEAGKSIEGYVSESEEEIGEPGDTCKSIKGINVAEPEEASVKSGDAGKRIEVISVAESDEASMEFGHDGETKKSTKVAASEEASVECVSSTDKSMWSVSDEAATSSSKHGEKAAGCALSEAASFSDSVKVEEGSTIKADSDSTKSEKEERLIAIVSPERVKYKEEVIPSTPLLDIVVCDSCDSDTEVKVTRLYRKNYSLINLG